MLLAEHSSGTGVFHRAAWATLCTFRSSFTALHPLNHCPWAGRGKHSKAGTHSKQVSPPVLLVDFFFQIIVTVVHKAQANKVIYRLHIENDDSSKSELFQRSTKNQTMTNS